MQRKNYFLASISIFFLVLSFPRFDFEFLAWLALIPWFVAIEDKTALEAGRFSFFLGLIFWIILLFWLRFVTVLGLTLLAVYLSFYFFLWGWGVNFVRRKTNFSLVVISPILWVGLEWLRGNFFTGFPWLPLGNSQYLNLHLIQIAEFSGVYGLSFLIVAVNAALAEIFIQIKKEGFLALRNKWAGSLFAGILLLFTLGYGKKSLEENNFPKDIGRSIRAGVIQGNIAPEIKWVHDYEDYSKRTYQSLTLEAGSNHPDLIVWPETAVTVSLPEDLEWRNILSFLTETSGSFLLTGSLYYPAHKEEYFNSAFLISPEGEIKNRYDKIHLVPFGEYVPKKKYFPSFFDRILQEAGDYQPGRKKTIFKIPDGNFNVLICFEDIFPDLVRQFVKKGSELLINITNDVWFGKTSAPYQHIAMSVFRAVENRRYLVRSANSGISAFIDPHGKIFGRVEDKNGNPIWIRGYSIQKVGLVDKFSFYTRFGDWFAYLNLALGGILIILGIFNEGGYHAGGVREKNQGVREKND